MALKQWLTEQRPELATDIFLDISDDTGLVPGERWKEALHVVTDALPHLAEANLPPLEDRLKRAQSEFRIAAELETARESNPVTPKGEPDYRARAAEYKQVLARNGLRIDDAEEELAEYIRNSMIRDQLLAAIVLRMAAA